MPPPTSNSELLDLIQKSQVVDDSRLTAYVQQHKTAGTLPAEPAQLARLMIREGVLTNFQAQHLMAGKWRGFYLGKYKVLEKLGSGGMGQVYLCEHKVMRRRVALKVLPTAKADDDTSSSRERFEREARAVAALDHPNIVRAYDIDESDNHHFLVMEYVDGPSLQEMVKRTGPLDPVRACHYMYQSALGLQHAFDQAGLIHRDIKPGNILVDSTGTVKILDMGLARFFHDEEDLLTKKYDETVLGTADYLAPEQALDSHSVDIRADIYSLGATFYFLLTGNPPFVEGTVAQKLMWHQTRHPRPVAEIRSDVPAEIVAVIRQMMEKDPNDRYQLPRDVAAALEPFTQTPIPPPSEAEMPPLSPAARGSASPGPRSPVPTRTTSRTEVALPTKPMQSPAPRRGSPTSQPAAPVAVAPTATETSAWTGTTTSETPNPKMQVDTVRTRSGAKPTGSAVKRPQRPAKAAKKSGAGWVLWVGLALLVLAVAGVGAAIAFGLIPAV